MTNQDLNKLGTWLTDLRVDIAQKAQMARTHADQQLDDCLETVALQALRSLRADERGKCTTARIPNVGGKHQAVLLKAIKTDRMDTALARFTTYHRALTMQVGGEGDAVSLTIEPAGHFLPPSQSNEVETLACEWAAAINSFIDEQASQLLENFYPNLYAALREKAETTTPTLEDFPDLKVIRVKVGTLSIGHLKVANVRDGSLGLRQVWRDLARHGMSLHYEPCPNGTLGLYNVVVAVKIS